MEKNLTIIGAVLIGLAMFGGDTLDKPLGLGIGGGSSVVRVETPSAELRALVSNVSSVLAKDGAGAADRIALGNFYRDAATIIAADPNVARTTGQFRSAYIDAGSTMFTRLNLKKKYDGLASAIEQPIQTVIKLDNRPLTEQDRQGLKKILEAIAWACYGG